jgi:ferrous iron transport protein B
MPQVHKKSLPDSYPPIDDRSHPQIILVGQPNCGKSTIFNKVAGYRSISTNFPGATVEFTSSHVHINGQTVDLIDLPGIYSLTSLDDAAEETKSFLITQPSNVIINVVDASILSRGLELTLQLLEIGIPLVLCLNMMDEATRKGILIDIQKLAEALQVPVVNTIASKGVGIDALFEKCLAMAKTGSISRPLPLSKHVEELVKDLAEFLHPRLDRRFRSKSRLVALKLLEEDPFFQQQTKGIDSGLDEKVSSLKIKLSEAHGQPSDMVISADRHALAMQLFERAAEVHHAHKGWRDKMDDLLMHPFGGYFFMLFFLYLFFDFIFEVGGIVETPILNFFQSSLASLGAAIGTQTVSFHIISGIMQGLAGGMAIVLPYLLPFLIGMALMEDIGYLPRVAFLMDSFMHKIGLHGTSVIPGILGYGCSVPAVMATRILSSPKDRFIASVVAILVPCSARMTVIFGLVGYYLGGKVAFGIYILNLVVITVVGVVMSRLLPGESPGMILEMPSYQIPSVTVILSKTWLRMKDFVIIAWPLLILGSILLSLAEWYHLDKLINSALSPLTYILGLPAQIGTTLIFGVLRKELSMLMLLQALGTTNVSSVLSSGQILVYTLFVVFYFPCLATFGVLAKEIGLRKALLASLTTTAIALFVAFMAKIAAPLLF